MSRSFSLFQPPPPPSPLPHPTTSRCSRAICFLNSSYLFASIITFSKKKNWEKKCYPQHGTLAWTYPHILALLVGLGGGQNTLLDCFNDIDCIDYYLFQKKNWEQKCYPPHGTLAFLLCFRVFQISAVIHFLSCRT